MSFLNVLRKDCCILMRCLTHRFTNGAKVKVDSNNFKHLIRTIADDSKELIPKPMSNKIILRLKRQDGIAEGYIPIYRVQKGIAFISLHCAMLLCFIVIPVCAVVIGKRNDFKFPIKFAPNLEILNKYQLIMVSVVFGLILLSTFILVSRFPLRIYHKKSTNDYIAAYSNLLLPWKITKIHFKPGQVRRIPEEEKLFYQISNYMINGKKVIFIEESFYRPFDLQYMVYAPSNKEDKKL